MNITKLEFSNMMHSGDCRYYLEGHIQYDYPSGASIIGRDGKLFASIDCTRIPMSYTIYDENNKIKERVHANFHKRIHFSHWDDIVNKYKKRYYKSHIIKEENEKYLQRINVLCPNTIKEFKRWSNIEENINDSLENVIILEHPESNLPVLKIDYNINIKKIFYYEPNGIDIMAVELLPSYNSSTMISNIEPLIDFWNKRKLDSNYMLPRFKLKSEKIIVENQKMVGNKRTVISKFIEDVKEMWASKK